MEDLDVTPQSSAEEIQENQIFLSALIESLDTGSEDYAERYGVLKAQSDYCDNLLAAKQRPSTPQSSRTTDTLDSTNLPSRSRPAIPNWGFHAPSPSGFRANAPHYKPDLGTDGYNSESSSGEPLKRQRADSSYDQFKGNNKIPRTKNNDRPSTSASESADSLEEIDVLPKNQGKFYEMYKKRAQMQEARYKQEQRDLELARQLSQQSDGPQPPGQYVGRSHSHLQNSASLDRSRPPQPPLSRLDQRLPLPSYHASAGAYVKPEVSSTSAPNPFAPRHDAPTQFADSSDDDVEVIPPQHFRPTDRHRPAERPRPQERPTYNQAYGQLSMPEGFPTSQWTSGGAASSNYDPYATVNPQQLSQPGFTDFQGLSNFYSGQDLTTMERLQGFLSGIAGSAYNALPSTNAYGFPSYRQASQNGHHGQAGASVFGGYGVDEGEPGPSGLTSRQWDDLNDRNMGYMLSDPTKTKDEIAQLLENIRPDEELPPELREGGPIELAVPLMEHQKLGLTWLKQQEESVGKGSILADDMGLGKTIQALALILSRPSDDKAVKTTLIVAPVALLRQWEKEIHSKVLSKHRLKVHIHHGATAQKTKYARLAAFDVILTTYGTIGAELRRLNTWEGKMIENSATAGPRPELNFLGENSRWYRVILDEAQAIKNRNSQAAQAAYRLDAQHRLAMTGTPMMNNIEELQSLIRFLRIAPYHESKEFNKAFKPLKTNSTEKLKRTAMKRLQALLKAILLRRTKGSKIDGKPILNLRERVVNRDNAEFDDDQKAFYEHIAQSSRLQFNRYLKAGTIGKNYSNILVMLLRLRQACDHPHLIENHGIPVEIEATEDEMKNYATELNEGAVTRIKEADGAFECPICYDASENPTIFFPCGHDVCGECFTQMMGPSLAARLGEESSAAKCPECRQVVDPHKVLTYNLFMQVHLPERYKEKFDDEVDKEEEDGSDNNSETDSEFDSDDDSVNDNGDLDGFIVKDEEDVTEGLETEDDNLEPWTKVKRDEADESSDDYAKSTSSKKASKRRDKSRSKKKGKGKGKATKPKPTLGQLKKEGLRNKAAKKRYYKRLRKTFVSSAKIETTFGLLQGIRDNDPSEKTIIFSQFTSFLDLIEVPLYERKWSYQRYDGSMNAKDRNEAVEKFSEDRNCNVMLISLKAGNAGLNLNCASQVIILDPFWNPFIEEQAIDRAHRIGQMRDVHVHRVLIPDTIEDRIMALQDKKRDLINQALDEKAAQKVSRLGREELIYLFGSSERDAAVQSDDSSDGE